MRYNKSMNEKQTPLPTVVRPTKKQRELLQYIDEFIQEHGYSPSYREIMAGLNYTSVATVALHVNSLLKRGHIRKRDHSARSLEVVSAEEAASVTTNQISPSEEKWLMGKIEHIFTEVEAGAELTMEKLQDLQILLDALRVLGLEAAAQSFMPRLTPLRERVQIDESV